jgi:hypothetical protein
VVPGKIERQVEAMTNCDETSCGVYTAGVITDGEGTVIERVETGASGDVYPDLLVRMPIPPPL